MHIPADRWYNALQIRRSRRQFLDKPLTQEDLKTLQNFTPELPKGVRVAVVNEGNPERVFKGALGSYGKIKGAKAYAAFIGETSDWQENIGYAGEAFILEAAHLGVATCWVGGFFRAESVAEQIQIGDKEQVYAVTPLGYVEKDYTFEEKLMSGFSPVHKRKSLDQLVKGLPRDKWPRWVETALQAARLAPSAVNRQPWSFLVQEDSIKVSFDSPRDMFHVSKRLDCGIAMLHLEIGALVSGVEGTWEHLPSPEVAIFKRRK